MKFEVFTVAKIQSVVFWIVTLCGVLVGYQHFRSHLNLKMEAAWKCWYPTTTPHSITT